MCVELFSARAGWGSRRPAQGAIVRRSRCALPCTQPCLRCVLLSFQSRRNLEYKYSRKWSCAISAFFRSIDVQMLSMRPDEMCITATFLCAACRGRLGSRHASAVTRPQTSPLQPRPVEVPVNRPERRPSPSSRLIGRKIPQPGPVSANEGVDSSDFHTLPH